MWNFNAVKIDTTIFIRFYLVEPEHFGVGFTGLAINIDNIVLQAQ